MLSLILQVKNQQLIGSEITQSLLHKMAHKLQLQGKFPRVQVQRPKLEHQKYEKREGRNSAPYIYQAVLIFGTLVFPILVLSVFVWLSGPTWFSLFLLKFMITLFEILNVILLLWGSEYSGDLNSELVQYLNGPKEFTS